MPHIQFRETLSNPPVLSGSISHTLWPCWSRSGFSSGPQIPEQHLQRAALAQGRHMNTHKPWVLHSLTTGTNMSPQALAAASSGTGPSTGTAPRGQALTKQKDAGKQPPLLCPSARGSSTCTGSTEGAVGREERFVEASAPQL